MSSLFRLRASGWPSRCQRPLPGQYVVLRLPRPIGSSSLTSELLSLSGPLSTERYRISIEDRAQWGGWNLSERVYPGGRCTRGQFCRGKLHTLSPERGRWYCLARVLAPRLFWQCCTLWRRAVRRVRSSGCIPLAIGNIIHFVTEVRRLMNALATWPQPCLLQQPEPGGRPAKVVR